MRFERLRVSAEARIVRRQVAGGAAVHVGVAETGDDDLRRLVPFPFMEELVAENHAVHDKNY
jgi:hypothetical protein